ncbi:MAG: PepSY domain-containing protein [Cyanobacteria bacterium P01_D01_bin.44]
MIFKEGRFALGILGLLALGVIGCTDEDLSDLTVEAAPASEVKITFHEALQIAEASADGERAYSMERETEKGQPVIEVGIGGREIFVHAATGEIVAIDDLAQTGDQEDQEEIAEFLELQPLVTIGILEALQAGEAYAGDQAHTVELENEDDNLVYEVVVGRQEIYVDAGNGQVLYAEGGGADDEEQPSSIQVPGGDD